MKAVVFLQNAWSPKYAGKAWPRRSWLKALERSRSGQRLRSLESGYCYSGAEWWYENASPVVSATPDGFARADVKHMGLVILEQSPDVVIALGKEAERGLLRVKESMGPGFPLAILAPHPASRVLTNDLYRDIGSSLGVWKAWDFTTVSKVIRYKQERGRVVTEPDPWLVHRSLVKEK